MLIKKVKLHNVRSYTDETIVFPKGTILLSGDIGSGKSTILLSIAFALFGIDNEKLSGSSLLRKGAKNAHVELSIDVHGTEIVIKRGLKKTGKGIAQTPGHIITNGTIKNAMPIELKSDIINFLGYPAELVTKKKNTMYEYTVYCPQEQMKAILGDNAENRMDTLRKIFGIDKYKMIRENTAILTRELRAQKREMEAQTQDIEVKKRIQLEKKKRYKELGDEIKEITPRLYQLKQLLEQQQKKTQNIKIKVTEMQNKKRREELLLNTIRMKNELVEANKLKMNAWTSASIKQDKTPIDMIKNEVEKSEEFIHQTVTARKTLQQKDEMLVQRINEIEKELNDASSINIGKKRAELLAIEEKLKQKDDVSKSVEQIQKVIKKMQSVLKEYELRISHAHETQQKIATLAHCPVCLQDVTEKHKSAVHKKEQEKIAFCIDKSEDFKKQEEEKRSQLAEEKKKLEQLHIFEQKKAQLEIEVKTIDEQIKRNEEKKKLLESVKDEQNNTKEAIKKNLFVNIEQKIKELKKSREQLTTRKEEERIKKELIELHQINNNLDTEIKKAQQEIQNIQEETKKLSEHESQLEELQQESKISQSKERSLAIVYAQRTTEQNAIGKSISENTAEIVKKEALQKRVTAISEINSWIDTTFIPLTAAIERHVMTRIYHEFNDLFKQWFSLLISDDGIAGGIDEKFTPIITQNGYDVESEYLSGGERTSAALAYRLALNKVINDVIDTIKTKDIIILDEPTDGFSTEQLDRVRDVLDQLKVKQTIIVSHERKIESFVEHTIYITKSGGVSKVVH